MKELVKDIENMLISDKPNAYILIYVKKPKKNNSKIKP